MNWHLYIIDCDGRYYTGIATDPLRRLGEHRGGGSRAARFTRAARELRLVYSVHLGSRSLALRAEARLKKLSRASKEDVVIRQPPRGNLLDMLALHDAPDSRAVPDCTA